MLLTSGQVSMAISSAVVVAFTAALFLSGYAIQQRTVRHLRAAIRPETEPHIFLPDRFRDETTELEDGTIVMLDEYDRPVRMKAGRVSVGKASPAAKAAGAALGGAGPEGERNDVDEVVEITVQESTPDVMEGQQEQFHQDVLVDAGFSASELKKREDGDEGEEQHQQPQEGPPQPISLEEDMEAQAQPQEEKNPQIPPQPQAAPWEVRREDMPEELAAEAPEGEEGEKPISRAQRRRKIKEEIEKLSQGDEPLYYQRRLW
ncbi:hypothetical protein BD289DRAFT_443291 [Coniella lustricola]|uniref:Uncharacterized protein n=1 Tax=Coniella lustricola TaxID=2025994 RepID=A0A2T2ZX96_9PEZI|nr:hypothetical protein BD289DRAFT_443291 [Coniella lustricola]